MYINRAFCYLIPSPSTTSSSSPPFASTPSITFEHPRHNFHFVKLGVHHLIRLLQDSDEISRIFTIILSEESVGCSTVTFSSCTANSMDVIFGTVWEVVIYDKFDIIHI